MLETVEMEVLAELIVGLHLIGHKKEKILTLIV